MLIAEVVFSNIGGTATAIGDPPNVIIVSNHLIKQAVSALLVCVCMRLAICVRYVGQKEGGLKEGGLKEGELKEGGLKEGGLKEGGLKEGGGRVDGGRVEGGRRED